MKQYLLIIACLSFSFALGAFLDGEPEPKTLPLNKTG